MPHPQAHPSLYSTQGLVIPSEMRSEIFAIEDELSFMSYVKLK